MAEGFRELAVLGERARDGSSGTIKVRLVEDGQGRRRVDVRAFLESDRYTGPTKRGVLLTPQEARWLLGDAFEVDLFADLPREAEHT